MDRVVVTIPVMGICHMQVCAVKDATHEEILEVCNRENFSGTSNGWNEVCADNGREPIQCEDDENRIHYLVSC